MSASSETLAPGERSRRQLATAGLSLARIGPAAMLTLLTVAVATIGWLSPAPVALDVGAPTDSAYLRGFYDREHAPHGSYRWASARARVDLPAVRGPATLELRLIGRADRPSGTAITARAGDAPPADLVVAPAVPRRYLLLAGAGSPTLQLDAPDSEPAGADDPRRLAVALERVTLRPLTGITLPPLIPIGLLVATGLCCLAGLRLGGVPRRAAFFVALAASLGLAAWWGWARLWVEPFLTPTATGAAVVVALLVALRAGTARHPIRGLQLFLVLAAASALIPLYLFAAYGYRDWGNWQNLPLLLLPIGIAGLWLAQEPSGSKRRNASGPRSDALQPPADGATVSSNARGSRARRITAALALLVAAGYATGMAGIIAGTDYGRDFHAIYGGVADFLRGAAPLYDLEVIAANPLTDRYKYPPQFALLFAPLSMLSFGPAFAAWRLASVALLLLGAWALLRAYRLPLRSWPVAGLLLALLTLRPIADTLRYGQVDLLLLAIIALGLLALRRDRPWATGAWIGVAATLKLYPAYLLGLALARRAWRPVAGAALSGLALTLASLLVLGWDVHWIFLSRVLGATGVGTTWVENQTFGGLVSRALSPELVALQPDTSWPVRLASYGWAAALTALSLWLTRPAGLRADLGYGLWVTAMLLALPAAWMHYQVVVIVPLLQAFVLAEERTDGLPWPATACFALAWALLAHGNLWTFYGSELYGPYWQLILSYKLFGLLLLYAATALAGGHTGGADRARLTLPAPPAPP